MTQTLLRLELFGGFRLIDNALTVAELPRQQSSALLAYLALHLHKPLSRDELMAAFWPDEDIDVARHKLRQTLYAVRGQLTEMGYAPGSILHANRTLVNLLSSTVNTDVAEFNHLLDSFKAVTDAAQRTTLLSQAVNLYKGDLLPGFYQEVFTGEANRLKARYLTALRELTRAYKEAGNLDFAIDCAARLVAVDALAEEAHCELMRLYAAKGQISAVQRQYEEMQRVLDRDLNTQPSAFAKELAKQLLEEAQTVAVGRVCEPLPLPPSQEHRAPDVPTPEPASLYAEPASIPAEPRSAPVTAFLLKRGEISRRLIAVLFASALAIGGWIYGATRHPLHATAAKPPAALSTGIYPSPFRTMWTYQYTFLPDEESGEPTAITTHGPDTYLAGFVHTTSHDVDFLTVKLDAQGREVWKRRYDGPGHDVDRVRCIAVDGEGNVYVTGESDNGTTTGKKTRLDGTDFATLKYDPNGYLSPTWADNGAGVGVRRYNGMANGEERPVSLLVDEAQNVYVLGKSWGRNSRTGREGFNYALVKYDRQGSQRWVAPFDGGCGDDEPAAMALDRDGAIYVTGTSRTEPPSGPETDILTVKYNSEGREQWTKRFGANNHADDKAFAIGVDGGGNVYVVGEAIGLPGTPEADHNGAVVLSYAPNGVARWAHGTRTRRDHIEQVLSAQVAADGGTAIIGRASSDLSLFRIVVRGPDGLPVWTADDANSPLGAPAIMARGRGVCVCSACAAVNHPRHFGIWLYDSLGHLDRSDVVFTPDEMWPDTMLALGEQGRTVAAYGLSDGKTSHILITQYGP